MDGVVLDGLMVLLIRNSVSYYATCQTNKSCTNYWFPFDVAYTHFYCSGFGGCSS